MLLYNLPTPTCSLINIENVLIFRFECFYANLRSYLLPRLSYLIYGFQLIHESYDRNSNECNMMLVSESFIEAYVVTPFLTKSLFCNNFTVDAASRTVTTCDSQPQTR